MKRMTCIQLGRRDAPGCRVGSLGSVDAAGDVVAISLATSLGMGRAHAIAGVIEQQAGQQMHIGMRG